MRQTTACWLLMLATALPLCTVGALGTRPQDERAAAGQSDADPGPGAADAETAVEDGDADGQAAFAFPLADVFRYRDFSEAPALSLLGDAAVIPAHALALAEPVGSLRLNQALAGVLGAAWYPTTVPAKGGFVSRFRIRFIGQGALPGLPAGADGLAFLIRRADATDAVGDGGCGLGYSGLPRTLAVEFDTFENTYYCGFGDPNDNHVSIHVNASDAPGLPSANESFSVASTGAGLGVNLKDGQLHAVEVRYERGVLSVFIDDLQTPRVARAVDLAQALGATDGLVRVGFSASTASAWEGHYVEAWRMQAAPSLCPLSDFALRPNLSSNGVQVYQRGQRSEYMAVVDLSLATLHNLIELQDPPNPGYFVVQRARTWVNRGQNVCPSGSSVRLVRNGAYGPLGPQPGTSTNVAHGLTDSINAGFSFQGYETPAPGGCLATGITRPCCPAVGRLPTTPGSATLTCGSNVQPGPTPSADCWRVAEEFRLLAWDNANHTAAVSAPWAGSGGPDSVGGFEPSCVVSGNSRQRGYAGVVNEGVAGTTANGQVLLYTSGANRTAEHVQQCLESFGATRSSQVQLDGGGSVTLNVNGTNLVGPSSRALTHALVVCSP